jgi:hypothetical protein
MLLLGLLLLGATTAFAGLLIAYNSAGGPEYTATVFDHSLGTLNTLESFLAGIALTLVFCLGLATTAVGAGTARRRRAARRADRRDAVRLRAERDAMAARLKSDEALAKDSAAAADGSDSATRVAAGTKPVSAAARGRARIPRLLGR